MLYYTARIGWGGELGMIRRLIVEAQANDPVMPDMTIVESGFLRVTRGRTSITEIWAAELTEAPTVDSAIFAHRYEPADMAEWDDLDITMMLELTGGGLVDGPRFMLRVR